MTSNLTASNGKILFMKWTDSWLSLAANSLVRQTKMWLNKRIVIY